MVPVIVVISGSNGDGENLCFVHCMFCVSQAMLPIMKAVGKACTAVSGLVRRAQVEGMAGLHQQGNDELVPGEGGRIKEVDRHTLQLCRKSMLRMTHYVLWVCVCIFAERFRLALRNFVRWPTLTDPQYVQSDELSQLKMCAVASNSVRSLWLCPSEI